jgi:hypothetical protein
VTNVLAKSSPHGASMTLSLDTSLFECFTHVDALLLPLAPASPADQTAVDHQIVAIDEGGFVAGQEHRGLGDIFGQARSRDRLRFLEQQSSPCPERP